MSGPSPRAKEVFDHPTLGQFRRISTAWGRRMNVRAFDAFSWPGNYKYTNTGRAKGRYGLRISGEKLDELPTASDWQMLEQVLDNPQRVVKLVIDSLWDDFNGVGPDSQMWWRGNLAEVARAADLDVSALNSPEDLLPCLKLEGLCLSHYFDNRREAKRSPLISILFRAAFEDEHGVGVLIDGKRVVGIGYSTEVQRFS